MGHVHDGDAVCLQLRDHLEQIADLGLREHCGGFIHDHDSRVSTERLRDLDPLPIGDGERAHETAWVDREVDPGEQRAGAPALGPTGQHTQPARLVAQAQVLCHRQVGGERQFLVHHRHTKPQLGEARSPELDRLAPNQNGTVIRSLNLRQQLHQGRLTGAVLTDDDVHLTGQYRQADPVNR
jgi:hypothetical protein